MVQIIKIPTILTNLGELIPTPETFKGQGQKSMSHVATGEVGSI